MTLLAAFQRTGAFEPIDVQVGRLLARRAAALGAGSHGELIAVAAARLSAERRRGHSCVTLTDLSEPPSADDDARERLVDVPLPAADQWASALGAAGALCGDGADATPLVLDGDRVYLYRYWAAERRLARNLRRFLAAPAAFPSAETAALHARIFPRSPGDRDWQSDAADMALARRYGVIAGGPGTGKTTTVARILALLLTESPRSQVALAAPTGKAAARLKDAIEGELRRLALPSALRDRIPTRGQTLHRLLNYRPWDDRFGHGAERPLTEDVIVVDEASMVDLLLMDALFDALRPDARVLLLGDHGQLASVETGAVLGDICRLAEAGREPLDAAVVRLRRSWRFEKQPGIGALATALHEGDSAAAIAALGDARYGEIALHAYPEQPLATLAPVESALDAYLAAGSPAEALDRLDGFRILCATYAGDWGVDAMTARVEERLRRSGQDVDAAWYDREPILVTANDYATELFNGDVGVVFEREGVRLVWFRDGKGGVRHVAPARLPAHRSAWAMTVHKAQGSEFGQVLLVLPDGESRVLTRELLYTGVTRARERVDIVGRADTLAAGCARSTRRRSGFAEALER